jgi:hypothetical protein
MRRRRGLEKFLGFILFKRKQMWVSAVVLVERTPQLGWSRNFAIRTFPVKIHKKVVKFRKDVDVATFREMFPNFRSFLLNLSQPPYP